MLRCLAHCLIHRKLALSIGFSNPNNSHPLAHFPLWAAASSCLPPASSDLVLTPLPHNARCPLCALRASSQWLCPETQRRCY